MAKYKCLIKNPIYYENGMIYDGKIAKNYISVAELAKRFPEGWELVPEFNKGDKIQVSNSGEIWRERIFHGMYNNKYVDCDFKIWNQAKKKPLLVTEDGVELFNEGDIVHYSNEDIKDKCDTTVVKLASELPECTKFFSTMEASQTYIDSLEPKYVPFTFEDRDIFRDKWVTFKGLELEYRILIIKQSSIVLPSAHGMEYKEAFKELKFKDGSPFGKQVK